MDPLSDVLALLKPQSYVSRGFEIPEDTAIRWGHHTGIKCYAILAGQCWLTVQTVPGPLLITAGDCFLLPRGLPFSLTTTPGLTPIDFDPVMFHNTPDPLPPPPGSTKNYFVGGHFLLTGSNADILLQTLPPIVHIRKESDKAAMRWSLERMKDEFRDPQPGTSLIAQQLASMMLVQALRLFLAESAGRSVGWLFALADKQMNAAITAMHDTPGQPWTLDKLASRVGMSRSIFAQRFKQTVGDTPMEYLTRWRMLLAEDKLTTSADPIATIAQSLGYTSESAFSKAYRRIMSCSPGQTRRAPTSP